MKRSSRAALVLLVLVLIAGSAAYAMRGRLATAAMGQIYNRALGENPIAELPDGLHIGLCGTGSPMADPTRVGPCVAVVAGKQLFVVDSGSGSTRNLSLMNLPPPRVDAVFVTHFHSDHIADLGELMLQRWAGGARSTPLPIYGPAGIEQVVDGFEAAYQLDRGARIAHHGEAVAPPSGFGGEPRPFPVDHRAPDVLLIDEPDLKVFAFPVEHHPAEEAVGYLFIYKGRRLVISGDTSASSRLEAAAKGADLLAHEGLQPSLVAIQHRAAVKGGRTNVAKILSDIPSYHATPEQAAAIAERAGVKALLFYHEIPPLPIKALNGPFLGKAGEIYSGPIQVGQDGDFISLPAGSSKIVRSNRLKTFRF
jgi:ribonuclease Z